MEQEEMDNQESLNSDENTELEPESEGESVDALKEKLLKAEEVAKNQRIRAEKAESLAKQLKKEPEEKETPKNDLSQKDIIYLAKADIHEDDLEEVLEYAKFKKVGVNEAHKFMKPILAEKAEIRKTAEATNTGGGRNVVNKIAPEKLVSDLSEGKVPEKGSQEAEELFWARHGGRKS